MGEIKSEVINDPKAQFLDKAGFISMDQVRSRSVDWLWKPYIPLGAITVLQGDPSAGKSWISHALAAAISNGDALPDEQVRPPSMAILLSAEDGLAETVKPRLEILGANMNNVIAPSGPFSLDEKGFQTIDRLASEYKPLFISLDPLFSFVGEKVDVFRPNQVRPFLHRLGGLAQKHGFALLAIRHLTKGARDRTAYRGSGTIDITAVARSVLLAGLDPKDQNKRAIVHNKCNLAALGPSFGYAITEEKFHWLGPVNLSASEMLAPELIPVPGALNNAKEFLIEILADGEMPANEIFKQAENYHLSRRTIERAKTALNLTAQHRGAKSTGGGGAWYWDLPEEAGKGGRGRQTNTSSHSSSILDSSVKKTGTYDKAIERGRQLNLPTLAESPITTLEDVCESE